MSSHGEIISTRSSFIWSVIFCQSPGWGLCSPNLTTCNGLPDSPVPTGTLNWFICLFPKGFDSKSKDYVSISVRPLKKGINASVKISLLNIDNKAEKTYTIDKPNNDAWRVTEFIKRTDLMKEKNRLLTNDMLSIMVEIEQFNGCNLYFDHTSVAKKPNVQDFSAKLTEFDGFAALIDNEKYSDVIFTVDDKVIKAHKCILAMRSDFFAAMFEHDTVEKKQNIIEIVDISYEILKEMLRFIYTGKVNDIEQVAIDLLPVADKYLLKGLKTLCEEFLCKNLSVENVAEYHYLADIHRTNVLKTKVIEFITSNVDKLRVKS